MVEPTPEMQAQFKTHARYLQVCVGWDREDVLKLSKDYHEAMQCPASFEIIQAHLNSVVPGELAALERRERNAA